MILLDTNILVYATDTQSERHEESKRVVDAVIEGRIEGALVPQILVEFIGATTGPTMENPLNVADAVSQAATFRGQIRTLQPPGSAFDQLVEIVQATGRAGRRTFDYFLAAQAKALSMSAICTYNIADFAGAGILLKTPNDIELPPADA